MMTAPLLAAYQSRRTCDDLTTPEGSSEAYLESNKPTPGLVPSDFGLHHFLRHDPGPMRYMFGGDPNRARETLCRVSNA